MESNTARLGPFIMKALGLGSEVSAAWLGLFFFCAPHQRHLSRILAEGAIALSVTLSGGALLAS